jgi:hypothetical protein
MDGSRWRKGRPLGISAMKLAKDKVILPLKFSEKCKIFLTSAFSSDYAEERKGEGVALSIRAMKVTKGKQIFLLQPSCQKLSLHSKYFARFLLCIVFDLLLIRSSREPTEGNIIYIN